MGNAGLTARVEDVVIDQADQQHLAWLSRSFGSSYYAPLSAQDLNALFAVAEVIAKYPAAHLSTLLSVSRQSVNEALSRLRDQHALETGYRHIRVLDPAKLARIAGF